MAAALRSCEPGRVNQHRSRAIRRWPGALRRRAACGRPGAGARPARPGRASMAASLSPAPRAPPSKTATSLLRPARARGFAIGSASRSTRGMRDPLSGIARARGLQGTRTREAARGARRRGIRTSAPSRCRPACEIVQLVRAHRCRHAFASAYCDATVQAGCTAQEDGLQACSFRAPADKSTPGASASHYSPLHLNDGSAWRSLVLKAERTGRACRLPDPGTA